MASFAVQTTEIDTGGEAPRLILAGGTIVPLSKLPQSGRDAIAQLVSAVALATGESNMRYLITVASGAVSSVGLAGEAVTVPAAPNQLHLITLGKGSAGERKVVSAAAVATGVISTLQELIVTGAPGMVQQLLATGGFEVSALNTYLTAATIAEYPEGPHYLAVIRLDEAALMLYAANFDIAPLMSFIASTNWQSPEQAPNSQFLQLAAQIIPEWIDSWS